MRSTRYKSGGSTGGGGGPEAPDIVWADQAKYRDVLGQVNPRFPDTPRFRDQLALNPALADRAVMRDARVSTVPSATATKPDTLKFPDQLSRAHLQDIEVARSGTPDSDRAGDFWADRALPTATHGNENLRVQAALTPGITNDEQEAFLKWNLTTLQGMSVRTGGSHSLKFFAVNNDLLLAKNIGVQMFHNGTTDPFTESTANWNTRPTGGTAIGSGPTLAVPANTAAQLTYTLTDADVTSMLTRWVYCRFFSAEILATIFFTITSRDAASNRPQLTLDLRRA